MHTANGMTLKALGRGIRAPSRGFNLCGVKQANSILAVAIATNLSSNPEAARYL